MSHSAWCIGDRLELVVVGSYIRRVYTVYIQCVVVDTRCGPCMCCMYDVISSVRSLCKHVIGTKIYFAVITPFDILYSVLARKQLIKERWLFSTSKHIHAYLGF